MIRSLAIEGAFVITHSCHSDDRGWFQRVHSESELRERNLVSRFPQSNASFTRKPLTVRGLHMQAAPFAETKIVSCLQGKVFDVIIDLRKGSKTFATYASVELEAGDGQSVYVPAGCAHGFQTLSENVLLNYLMSEVYHPENAVGVHWLDEALAIKWPSRDSSRVTISEKDQSLPSLREL